MTLNDVCLAIVDCEHKTAPTEEYGIPSIRTTDILNGNIDFKAANKVSLETYSEWTKRLEPKPLDLILAREAPVGEVGIIPPDQKACLGQRTVLLRPNDKIVDPYYLLYLLVSPEIKNDLVSRGTGSTVEHLNMSEIRSFTLPDLPSLKEQKDISSVLKGIDRKISLLHRQNEILEEMAQAIFRHWFVDFEFPMSAEQAAGVGKPELEGKPYRSNGGKMVDSGSEFGEVPEGWEVDNIGNYIKVLGGGTPSTKINEYWKEGTINWYSPTDLTKSNSLFSFGSEKRITDSGLKNSSAKLLKPYSILLTSRATIGEMTITTQPAATNQGFINLVPDSIDQMHFTFFWVRQIMPLILSNANGSTFLEISKGNFKALPIFTFPVNIQTQFSSIVKPMFDMIELNLKQVKVLNELRDLMLPKLMNGEITL